MITKIFRKLFGLCEHDYTSWDVVDAKSNAAGSMIVMQSRQCKKCGYRHMIRESL